MGFCRPSASPSTLRPCHWTEVLDFRKEHGGAYKAYARDLRRTIAQLSPLSAKEREQLLYDRRDELADRAHELRQIARRAWRRPMVSAALGAVGAGWLAGGGILAGIFALGKWSGRSQPSSSERWSLLVCFRGSARISPVAR